MKLQNRATILYIIQLISVLGLVTSLYLTNAHLTGGSTACDISPTVSCSFVNTSTFSEIFGIPVALLGMVWFVVLSYLGFKYFWKPKQYVKWLFWWSIVGILSVVYLIWAEIILGAICLYCTFVHVLVLITFGLVLYLRKKR
ncbi:Vitamin K epoxide reductase [Candidatus Woesearchaeota archaeon CG10_big_fil_rev_8_21_14_0_10_45_16]|nr:MAG: Vitamin K epoxide reductase [Candidatus Woesearchaeota archaeon CG10_big_fil_rev_8_21_14_0_10_45_16]